MSLSLGKIHYTREASARAFPPPLRASRARKSVLAVEKNAKYRGEFAGIIHTGARGKMPRINRGQRNTHSLSLSLSLWDHLLGMAGTRYISIYARSGPLAAATTTTTRLYRWDQPHCLFHKQICLYFDLSFFFLFEEQSSFDELASFSWILNFAVVFLIDYRKRKKKIGYIVDG